MKRIFGLILSLVIGTALLEACGSTATTRPITDLSQTPTPTSVLIPGITSKKGDSNFSLQVSMDGTISRPDGTITYGPNTAMIPLEIKQNTYEGSYVGEFNAKVTGECNGAATYPVTFNVTAKGAKELDFSVKSSIGMTMTGSCGTAGGSIKIPPATGTLTFKLPAEDGASKVYDMPLGGSGKLTITFTLKK